MTEYTDIPRVDVHTHMGGAPDVIANHLRLRALVREQLGVDVALWVDLGQWSEPREGEPVGGAGTDLERVAELSEGRVLCCIHDYNGHRGMRLRPDDLPSLIDRGFLGYKIWYGPPSRGLDEGEQGYPYVDDPAHEPTFAAMEEHGTVGASVHIADPNGPFGDRHEWLPDPVEYWRIIGAWRHVLERHPRLQAVTAHMSWLCCQDAQLDYLRNLLATFPGLSVDLAATFQYYHLLDSENLRDFMVEYADRILFGTDQVALGQDELEMRVERLGYCFRILETDEIVPGGYFSDHPTRGLALPRDVLEHIYWRNAARIYPRLGAQLRDLGYDS